MKPLVTIRNRVTGEVMTLRDASRELVELLLIEQMGLPLWRRVNPSQTTQRSSHAE